MKSLFIQPDIQPQLSFGGSNFRLREADLFSGRRSLFDPLMGDVIANPPKDQHVTNGAIGLLSHSLIDAAADWVRSPAGGVVKGALARRSVFDLPPLSLGDTLQPFEGDDDIFGEMLDDTRF